MQIFVQAPDGRKMTFNEVEGRDSVESLREKVARHGHPKSRQILYFTDPHGDHHTLVDGHALDTYMIHKEATLILALRPKPRVVMLNVGGKRVDTLLSTLTAVRGSTLCRMFEGLLQQGGGAVHEEGEPGEELIDVPVDASGAFMIDRDPLPFRYIINYLRNFEGREPGANDGGAASELPHMVALRAELETCKTSVLKRRAMAIGVDADALLEADDADDVKGTVIRHIIAAVGPARVDLPESTEELQLLVREAQHFGLPELVATCRQKMYHDRQGSENDRVQMRELLGEEFHGSEEERMAAIAEIERMCGGDLNLRTLREQHQRIADKRMMQDLVATASFTLELQKQGLSANGAAALTSHWSGKYMNVANVAGIDATEAQMLGLEAHDVQAAQAVGLRFRKSGPGVNVDGNSATGGQHGSGQGRATSICAGYAMRAGQHYAEFTMTAAPSNQLSFGIVSTRFNPTTTMAARDSQMYSLHNGQFFCHGKAQGSGGPTSYAAGKKYGLLLDLPHGLLMLIEDGVAISSTVPIGITGPVHWAVSVHYYPEGRNASEYRTGVSIEAKTFPLGLL